MYQKSSRPLSSFNSSSSSSCSGANHLPFRFPNPSCHAVHQNQIFVSKKHVLGLSLLQKRQVIGSIAGHIDHFVVLPVTDTIVEQLTVEAGRNRVPHLPLHHSRGLGIILRSFQDVVFLEHCGILWYPLVILIENLLGSFDSFCNRVHLATCHQSLFAFSLKNLFLSNHSVAPI